MIIDGVEYEPVQKEGRRKQIIVAHRGWVFVGDCEDTDTNVVIHDASNVRRWGTSSGLGELAADGPQSETVLDESGTVTIPLMGVVCRYDCEVASWT